MKINRARPNQIRGRDRDALFSKHRRNGHHGYNNSCLLYDCQNLLLLYPEYLTQAHPENQYRMDKLPSHAPCRCRSHNGREQSGTYAMFYNACIVRLDDPGKEKLAIVFCIAIWVYLFVDMLQGSVCVLTVANTMASHTRLAGILFAFDQHLGYWSDVEEGNGEGGGVGRGGSERPGGRTVYHKKICSTFKM